MGENGVLESETYALGIGSNFHMGTEIGRNLLGKEISYSQGSAVRREL